MRIPRGDETLTGSFIDILLPPVCPLCEKDVCAGKTLLCGACHAELCSMLIKSPMCAVCGMPFVSKASEDHLCSGCIASPPPYAMARSVLAYDGPVKEAVHLLKYSGRTNLGAPLGGLLPMIVEGLPDLDQIIPVPLHISRLRSRGFNQSVLLARELSRSIGRPLVCDNLKRVRNTEQQTNLTHEERRSNVAGAFALDRPEEVDGATVALVDDVYTTGATIRECAKVLKKAGAAVYSLTLARVVKV